MTSRDCFVTPACCRQVAPRNIKEGKNKMTNEQFIASLDKILEEKSILKHPFYRKWNEGKLTLGELKDYAKQYYHFVKHFPMFVSSGHSYSEDTNIRRMLVENIADEDGFKTGIEDHPELWLKFAGPLGVTKNECEDVKVCPEV